MLRIQHEDSHLQARKRVPPRTQPCWHPDLRLPSLQNHEKKVLFKSHPVCGISLWQPEVRHNHSPPPQPTTLVHSLLSSFWERVPSFHIPTYRIAQEGSNLPREGEGQRSKRWGWSSHTYFHQLHAPAGFCSALIVPLWTPAPTVWADPVKELEIIIYLRREERTKFTLQTETKNSVVGNKADFHHRYQFGVFSQT